MNANETEGAAEKEEIKELAREYIDNCTERAGFVILTENIKNDFIDLFVAGFMKCLELNKEAKWHDLRKDPNDLPKIDIGRTSITVLNEDGNKVYYDYYSEYWRYDDEELNITTPPVGWCEIPKFEEK